MTKRARTPALWLVTWEAWAYVFQGVGATPTQAEGALLRAIEEHCADPHRETLVCPRPEAILFHAKRLRLVAGTGYRDGALLAALPGVAE